MEWLKNNLKFDTPLFWLLCLIAGIILAVKGFGFILLVYASIMCIGKGIIYCGKFLSIDFSTRKWYLISITIAILWFIVAIAEIVIQIKKMLTPEDLLHQIEVFKNALLVIAFVTYIADFKTKNK
ncbi:hypothetical protein [Anaerotignum sp.]